MQEIILFFLLIPRGFNEFHFVVKEMKVERKGTEKLNKKRNCLSFYYFLYHKLVGN